MQDGGKSTGIFTKYLNKYILQSEKVTHILEKVSEGRCFIRGSNALIFQTKSES